MSFGAEKSLGYEIFFEKQVKATMQAPAFLNDS